MVFYKLFSIFYPMFSQIILSYATDVNERVEQQSMGVGETSSHLGQIRGQAPTGGSYIYCNYF